MAASADSDDTHIRPAGLEALPAVLAQQVYGFRVKHPSPKQQTRLPAVQSLQSQDPTLYPQRAQDPLIQEYSLNHNMKP